MPDDDWNSGYKKLRCVSLSTGFTVGRPNRSRECFEMENPLFIVIHRSIPWINFNQFGWMHSIVKANIWAIPRNGDDLSATIWHTRNRSARRNTNQLRGTREANTRRGIFDSVLFAASPAASGSDAAMGPHGWGRYSCRTTRTRKIITVVCLFVRATRSPTRMDWFGERILIWNPFQSRISCFSSTQSTQNGREAWLRSGETFAIHATAQQIPGAVWGERHK